MSASVTATETTAHYALTVAWVQHHSHARTEGLWWDVSAELGANHTRVAVRAGDSAPDDADLGALSVSWRLVDVCDALLVTGKEKTCELAVLRRGS